MSKRYFQINVGGQLFEVDVTELAGPNQAVQSLGAAPAIQVSMPVAAAAPAPVAAAPAPVAAPVAPAPAPAAVPQGGAGAVASPMPGVVLSIDVAVGDQVTMGQVVAKMEAMKMEIEVTATAAGTIKSIAVSKGASVNTGDTIMVIG